MSTLEERVARLEDLEALRTLTARYADLVNQGWNDKATQHARLGECFTPDAEWISSAMNVHALGLDDIVAMLEKSNAAGNFAMHSFTNPVIEIDGDAATGDWLLWVAVGNDTKSEVFQSEKLTYVRTPAGWRIQRLELFFGGMLSAG